MTILAAVIAGGFVFVAGSWVGARLQARVDRALAENELARAVCEDLEHAHHETAEQIVRGGHWRREAARWKTVARRATEELVATRTRPAIPIQPAGPQHARKPYRPFLRGYGNRRYA